MMWPTSQNDERCSVVFMAATRVEIEPVYGLLTDLARTSRMPCAIAADYCGIGAERAVRKFHELAERHAPDLFVLLGFSGGLDPTLKTGDAVCPHWIINEQRECFRTGAGVPRSEPLPPDAPLTQVHLTIARLVDSPKAKEELRARYPAGAVDMESFAVARAAAERQVRLAVVRVIFDSVDVTLPPGCDRWVRPDGRVDGRAVALYTLARPWSIGALWRMRNLSRKATEGLRIAVQRTVLEPLASGTPVNG